MSASCFRRAFNNLTKAFTAPITNINFGWVFTAHLYLCKTRQAVDDILEEQNQESHVPFNTWSKTEQKHAWRGLPIELAIRFIPHHAFRPGKRGHPVPSVTSRTWSQQNLRIPQFQQNEDQNLAFLIFQRLSMPTQSGFVLLFFFSSNQEKSLKVPQNFFLRKENPGELKIWLIKLPGI